MADFNVLAGCGRIFYVLPTSSGWAAIHDASAGTAGDTFLVLETNSTGGNYVIGRLFLPFDTSTIPANATITSAILKLYRDDTDTAFSNGDTTSMHVVTQTQSAPTVAINNTDYDLVSFTSIGSATLASTTDHTYVNITITDLTKITKAGNTLLGLLNSKDQTNIAPAGVNDIAFGKRADANPPILTVTYTLPSGVVGDHSFFM